jgi:hypothetical protein
MGKFRRKMTGRAVAVAVAVAFAVSWCSRPAVASVSINAPAGPVSMGTATSSDGGLVISHQLGNVVATGTGILGLLLGSFDATVTLTVTFTTGGGSVSEQIPKANVKYWSGTASASSGGCTAGQANAAAAEVLTATRAAYSCGGLLNVSATWNPTIVITLPTPLIAGTYTATITHSAA